MRYPVAGVQRSNTWAVHTAAPFESVLDVDDVHVVSYEHHIQGF